MTYKSTRLGSRVENPGFIFFFAPAPQGEIRNDTELLFCQVYTIVVTVHCHCLCHRQSISQSVSVHHLAQQLCPHRGFVQLLWIHSVRLPTARRRSCLLRSHPDAALTAVESNPILKFRLDSTRLDPTRPRLHGILWHRSPSPIQKERQGRRRSYYLEYLSTLGEFSFCF